MVFCVVPHDVAFFCHSFDHVRSGIQKITGNEKSGRYLFLFQSVKDRSCKTILISAVKGKIQNLLFCVFGIVGMMSRQFFNGGVAGGKFAFFRVA